MAIDRLKKKVGKGRHLSTMKRTRQTEKKKERNRRDMTAMRTAIKKARTSLSKADLAKAVPIIAKNAKKGFIHYKKASRLISRLTKAVNARQ